MVRGRLEVWFVSETFSPHVSCQELYGSFIFPSSSLAFFSISGGIRLYLRQPAHSGYQFNKPSPMYLDPCWKKETDIVYCCCGLTNTLNKWKMSALVLYSVTLVTLTLLAFLMNCCTCIPPSYNQAQRQWIPLHLSILSKDNVQIF